MLPVNELHLHILLTRTINAAGYRNNSSVSLSGVGTNSYVWSASPASSSNGRNLYFNSSSWSWNNNNRSNGNAVRPVQAYTIQCYYSLIMKVTKEQLRMLIYAAYNDARCNKRNTLSQLNFEVLKEHHLENLVNEIWNRRYQPLPAICFVSMNREIYASYFRDRVVQHLLFNMLNPLVETLLIYDTYSCRKKKGTLMGVSRYEHHLRSVTDNFRKEAWVFYIDLSGYFMSIDRELAISIIMKIIDTHLYP